MEQERFTAIKAEVLRLAKAGDACDSEYRSAANAETIESLMGVITANFYWCVQHGLINPGLLEAIGDDVLWQHGVYRAGKHDILVESGHRNIFLLANSSATVETRENSSVRDLTNNIIHLQKDRWTIVQHETETDLPT